MCKILIFDSTTWIHDNTIPRMKIDVEERKSDEPYIPRDLKFTHEALW